MNKNIIKIVKVLVILLILFLGFTVRRKNYAEIPIPGQSLDEYSNSWAGLSLIEVGMPVASSGIGGNKFSIQRYVNVDHFFQTVSSGDPITINYPWMDHPPLLGLITGGYAYLKGARVFEDTTSLLIRRPIIVISSISVGLLMVFCWLNFGFLTAVIGGLLYATVPLIVLSGRMIQGENAVIPCLLGCMIGISLYLRNKNDYWLVLTAISAGIATLFKLTGIVCYLFVFLTLLVNYKKIFGKFLKDFGFFLAISFPITLMYAIYGLVYGWETFKNILFSNYNRFYGIGPNSLIELIRNQRLTQHKFLPESSIISGWIIFFGYLFRKLKMSGVLLVILSLFSYLIIYIFFGSQPYGWYAFPFWPVLIILLAEFISKGIEKGRYIFGTFLILILILGDNISRLLGIFDFQPYANVWRLGVSGIFLALILLKIFKFKIKIAVQILLFMLVTAVIYTNLMYLNRINIDFWWQNIS